MTHAHLLQMVLCAALGADLPADFKLSPPPGSFVGAARPDNSATGRFKAGTPLVATSYFYWYDEATKAHLVDGDGTDALTDHPPTLKGLSYKNVDWHRGQLTDMQAAGIDIVLPVYWGGPHTSESWSDLGLPKLVAARKKLLDQGKRPPAIGMFYDTSTLRHNRGGYHVDLTTSAGQRWFYGTIRNFFSLIPAKHRATIDGKPLVLLYSHTFAKKVDDRLFPAVRRMYRAQFGTDLYLVKMPGWPGKADSQYQWGAALSPQMLDTAGIGPGYDHSAVPGRSPLVRKRDDGRFYRFGWWRLLAMEPATRPWLVHLETWNEFHEGTEICETAEFGRKYIDMTRKYAKMFHARKRIDPRGGKGAAAVVSATPAKSSGIEALNLSEGDGPIVRKTVVGEAAWCMTQNRHSDNRYMYFDVDYSFLYDGDESLEVTITYLDSGPRAFAIEYDSADPSLRGLAQHFRVGPSQQITGSGKWKQVRWTITHARFAGRANNADFRLACVGKDLCVSHISIRRPVKEKPPSK